MEIRSGGSGDTGRECVWQRSWLHTHCSKYAPHLERGEREECFVSEREGEYQRIKAINSQSSW